MSNVTVHKHISVLIADDETVARDRLRRFVEAEPDLHLAGECRSGKEARERLSAGDIDVLFLDVRMPEMDGFELIQDLPPEQLPLFVFVTAHDEYAVRAFEQRAVDYLLKPFDGERFRQCLERVRSMMDARDGSQRHEDMKSLADELRNLKARPSRFAVKTANKLFFVRLEDIDLIQAADNYVCLHINSEQHFVRETMNSIESRLDPDKFVRVHRSKIVNIDRIKELHPWFHGDYQVVLNSGAQITLSRTYRERLFERLKL
ncbi:MAG: LytTR family DNA-binding domain-containing protein [Bryobacteraceae bacterium]|nr:LytTR family DNA-binding domain-containing protein [Bryobacteraceae bacterium]